MRSGFAPGTTQRTSAKILLHVTGVMGTAGQGERGDKGVGDVTAAAEPTDDFDEPVAVILGIAGVELQPHMPAGWAYNVGGKLFSVEKGLVFRGGGSDNDDADYG
jgi:hypothetical protein